MTDPATPEALRAIASMMRMDGYRTDAAGVEALVLDNAADEIEQLWDNLCQKEVDIEALHAKIKSEGNCACSFDHVDDICMCHSPKLAAAVVENERLRKENGRLDSYNKELLYDNEQKYAEIQRLLRMVGK